MDPGGVEAISGRNPPRLDPEGIAEPSIRRWFCDPFRVEKSPCPLSGGIVALNPRLMAQDPSGVQRIGAILRGRPSNRNFRPFYGLYLG